MATKRRKKRTFIVSVDMEILTIKMLTSPDVPCKLATPPFAQSTGNCIDVPAKDIARAACPFPMTTRPANGRLSVCSHSDCSTFTENLESCRKHVSSFFEGEKKSSTHIYLWLHRIDLCRLKDFPHLKCWTTKGTHIANLRTPNQIKQKLNKH